MSSGDARKTNDHEPFKLGPYAACNLIAAIATHARTSRTATALNLSPNELVITVTMLAILKIL